MDSLAGFLNNAALMLVLCVFYDTFNIYAIPKIKLRDGLTGVLVGFICVAVMLNPWSLERGLYFDTRWVLLSLCGLYFGLIPTTVAVAIAGAFRLYQGGPGGIVGTVVIITTACVGLAWKYWKDRSCRPLNWMQLYALGVVVQLAMLSCMFLFPAELRNTILRKIALPILIIYPVLTTIIGLILQKQEDRRIADRALLYSTSLATSALDSTPDGILIVDREGKIARWNQKFVELWDVPEDLLDTTVKDPVLAHATSQVADPEEFLYKIMKLTENPEASSYDTLYLTDGRIFNRYSQPQKVGNEIVGRFWSFRDITERKKADDAIKASEAKFRTIFDSVNDAIFIHDIKSGAIVDVNQRMCEMFGMTHTEAIRSSVGELSSNISPYRQEDAANWLKKAAEGTPQLFEWRARHKNGTLFWVECSMRRSFIGTTDRILVTVRDITERKQTEDALANSERFLKTIIDSEPECIKMLDSNGNLLMMNPAGLAFIEADTFEQVQGKCVYPLISEPFRDAFRTLTEQVFQGISGTVEFEIIGLKGRHVWLETHAVPFCNEHGEIVSSLEISRDITERKRAEDERINLEKQILHAKKLESLGVLAGGIAHDFNNILTSIIGNTDLALMRINPESPVIDNLHSIEKAAASAADLARQMLAYSGKCKFLVTSHEINSLLEEMLHILQVSISKKAVLRLNLTRPLPPVEADATQIRQIIMNLVINASEAIGDKSGVIAITTGCMDCDRSYLKDIWLDENISDGLYVYIEIADTGCGMSKDTLAKLFDPFFTTKFTGRGLGMAAVLGIVRGHKGAVKVYSELGKGSSFKILLPASSKPAEIFNHEPQKENWKGSGTVILVDDEETVRGIGSEMLKELGFNVLTANDGREAIEVYKTITDISFIILDLTMPHVDGEQCFRELRMMNPEVKVIMSSGFSEVEVTEKFVGKGLAGFIQKPYKYSELRDVIMGLYGKKIASTDNF